MLTLKEKKILEERIYNILKESVFEVSDSQPREKESDNEKEGKRKSVMKWLKSAQQLHSTLAYELYNVTNASEDDKATYRSLFSKKYRGEDSNGNHYDFTPEEINSLYNMKDRFIKKIK